MGKPEDINPPYLVELKEQLTRHLSDDPLHQGDFKNKIRPDCGECNHLTRMITILETTPVRLYPPPRRPMPRVKRIK